MERNEEIVFSICITRIPAYFKHEVKVLNKACDNVVELLSKHWEPNSEKVIKWTLPVCILDMIKETIDRSTIDTISELEDIEPECYHNTVELLFCGDKKSARFRENNLYQYYENPDKHPKAKELLELMEKILEILNEEFGINISILD